jgi:hypothetical protein
MMRSCHDPVLRASCRAKSLGQEHDRDPATSSLIGALLNHATVIYRADRGYRGTDQFRYIALDSASSYPRHRVAATVTVHIGAG